MAGVCLIFGVIIAIYLLMQMMPIRGVSEDTFVLTDGCFTDSQLLGTTTNISVSRCAVSCHILTNCTMFAYNQMTSTCKFSKSLGEPNATTCETRDSIFTSTTGMPIVLQATCPTNYTLNPVASTCIRFVFDEMTWDEAKENCESQGESLATFDTYESVLWLGDFCSTLPVFSNYKWVGLDGRITPGVWRWIGSLSNKTMVDGDPSWLSYEPNGHNSGTCGCVGTGLIGDCRCDEYSLQSICEKNL